MIKSGQTENNYLKGVKDHFAPLTDKVYKVDLSCPLILEHILQIKQLHLQKQYIHN